MERPSLPENNCYEFRFRQGSANQLKRQQTDHVQNSNNTSCLLLTPMLNTSQVKRNSNTPGNHLADVSIAKTIRKNGELQMTQIKGEKGRNLVVIKSRNFVSEQASVKHGKRTVPMASKPSMTEQTTPMTKVQCNTSSVNFNSHSNYRKSSRNGNRRLIMGTSAPYDRVNQTSHTKGFIGLRNPRSQQGLRAGTSHNQLTRSDVMDQINDLLNCKKIQPSTKSNEKVDAGCEATEESLIGTHSPEQKREKSMSQQNFSRALASSHARLGRLIHAQPHTRDESSLQLKGENLNLTKTRKVEVRVNHKKAKIPTIVSNTDLSAFVQKEYTSANRSKEKHNSAASGRHKVPSGEYLQDQPDLAT